MAKRGRKPGSTNSVKKGYFYEKQEEAVLRYLNTDSAEEKNEIYNNVLRPAFKKMVESIIRRYRLYIPNEAFEDTFNDTLSFLLTKADKFKANNGTRAYSYYGTICKNYLKGRIQNYSKSLQRNPSYDSVMEEFTNSMKYSDTKDAGSEIASEAMEKLIARIGEMIEDPKKYNLKENEIKIGAALKTLLEHWEYVLTTDASDKLNKTAILKYLRESTCLDTKGVRDNMKKFKKEFLLIKSAVMD